MQKAFLNDEINALVHRLVDLQRERGRMWKRLTTTLSFVDKIRVANFLSKQDECNRRSIDAKNEDYLRKRSGTNQDRENIRSLST